MIEESEPHLATSDKSQREIAANPGVQGLVKLGRNVIELIAELEHKNASLLRLVADMRFALGDNGKRMQPELVEWCRELRADAERWRFAREHLAFSYSLHMDGTSNYDFNGRHLPRARSIDAAIDAARKDNGNG